ncbi:MAG: hypothetical protein ACREIC_26425, partial [Limisphaerales bacterium]
AQPAAASRNPNLAPAESSSGASFAPLPRTTADTNREELLRRALNGQPGVRVNSATNAEPISISTNTPATPATPPVVRLPALPAPGLPAPGANAAITPLPPRGTNPPPAVPSIPALPVPGQHTATAPTPGTNATAEEVLPAGTINFPATDLNQVLQIYAELVGRTVLRPTSLPAPTITLKTQTPLTRHEAVQAFDAVLALNGI